MTVPTKSVTDAGPRSVVPSYGQKAWSSDHSRLQFGQTFMRRSDGRADVGAARVQPWRFS